MTNLSEDQKKKLVIPIVIFLSVLSLYFAVKFLAELRNYSFMGSQNINTITVSGYGEVNAVPDIAKISLTIRKEAKTVKEAQTAVAEVENSVLAFLRESGVEDKDIKTMSASFNPKYEYQRTYLPCNEYGCPPNPGKSVIIGYEAYENLEIKIRNTDNAGKIIEGVGTLGVENLYGPNFSIDDEDALKAEARKLAIEEAKEKAEALSKDLGVRLGRVASFSENGDGYYPVYGKGMAMDTAVPESALSSQMPVGENTINSNVTIVYQIR